MCHRARGLYCMKHWLSFWGPGTRWACQSWGGQIRNDVWNCLRTAASYCCDIHEGRVMSCEKHSLQWGDLVWCRLPMDDIHDLWGSDKRQLGQKCLQEENTLDWLEDLRGWIWKTFIEKKEYSSSFRIWFLPVVPVEIGIVLGTN